MTRLTGRHTRSRRARARGLALVEATVALVVLMAGLLGGIQLYQLGIDHTHTLQQKLLAQTAVQNEIEYLRSRPFAEASPTDSGVFHVQDPASMGLLDAEGRVVIHEAPGLEGRLREVHVLFQWRGEKGRLIKDEAVTFIANKEALP